MMRIAVNTSSAYDVCIGSGILSQLGDTVARLTQASKVCIVSDSHVWPLYGRTVTTQLLKHGLVATQFVMPAGEEHKNTSTYCRLLEHLAENGLGRSDCIVALGGGVVGDLAGFAAATYLRGIPYVQVPTSLLAMVDSSVGGKTAIDLPTGKNLCGAFYQPTAVLCDPDVLKTLPEEEFRDGCGEVIKYALLFDPELFDLLMRDGLDFDRETIIARCIEHKRNCVQTDEFDRGQRMLLNLGHTIGHAIEKCSNYKITHGKAVSIGIATVCRGVKCADTCDILAVLEKFSLPTTTELAADALWKSCLSDKKRSGDQVNLIVCKAIGDCRIVPVSVDALKTLLEEGM